jgi:hypothetical protein
MDWVIACSCLVVALTFLMSALFPKSKFLNRFSYSLEIQHFDIDPCTHFSVMKHLIGAFSTFLLLLCFTAATWGSQDALMNFSPTFIWIIWWIGCSFGVVLFGNFWPLIDPWRYIYQLVISIEKRLSTQHNQRELGSIHLAIVQFHHHLGIWPAVIGLLSWCGLEIIYPIASMPHKLGIFIAGYSLLNWLGMRVFGMKEWCLTSDVFSVYFRYLASWRTFFQRENHSTQNRVADEKNQHSQLRYNFALSQIGFAIAMITSVLFDGLHAGSIWLWFESKMKQWEFFKNDVNGYATGIVGLLLTWFLLLAFYLIVCEFTYRITLLLSNKKSKDAIDSYANQTMFLSIGCIFLKSLLPIAFAYLVAHNFSSLFIQGQNIFQLISDPYGRMWNLWGTADYYPDITWIDAKVTWYVATFSIVLGHMISVLMGHHAAANLAVTLKTNMTFRSIWVLNLPMTFLMIAFTALSLSIIAEPLTILAG